MKTAVFLISSIMSTAVVVVLLSVHLFAVRHHIAAVFAREEYITETFSSANILWALGALKVAFLVIEPKVFFQFLVGRKAPVTFVAHQDIFRVLFEMLPKLRAREEERREGVSKKVVKM